MLNEWSKQDEDWERRGSSCYKKTGSCVIDRCCVECAPHFAKFDDFSWEARNLVWIWYFLIYIYWKYILKFKKYSKHGTSTSHQGGAAGIRLNFPFEINKNRQDIGNNGFQELDISQWGTVTSEKWKIN